VGVCDGEEVGALTLPHVHMRELAGVRVWVCPAVSMSSRQHVGMCEPTTVHAWTFAPLNMWRNEDVLMFTVGCVDSCASGRVNMSYARSTVSNRMTQSPSEEVSQAGDKPYVLATQVPCFALNERMPFHWRRRPHAGGRLPSTVASMASRARSARFFACSQL